MDTSFGGRRKILRRPKGVASFEVQPMRKEKPQCPPQNSTAGVHDPQDNNNSKQKTNTRHKTNKTKQTNTRPPKKQHVKPGKQRPKTANKQQRQTQARCPKHFWAGLVHQPLTLHSSMAARLARATRPPTGAEVSSWIASRVNCPKPYLTGRVDGEKKKSKLYIHH